MLPIRIFGVLLLSATGCSLAAPTPVINSNAVPGDLESGGSPHVPSVQAIEPRQVNTIKANAYFMVRAESSRDDFIKAPSLRDDKNFNDHRRMSRHYHYVPNEIDAATQRLLDKYFKHYYPHLSISFTFQNDFPYELENPHQQNSPPRRYYPVDIEWDEHVLQVYLHSKLGAQGAVLCINRPAASAELLMVFEAAFVDEQTSQAVRAGRQDSPGIPPGVRARAESFLVASHYLCAYCNLKFPPEIIHPEVKAELVFEPPYPSKDLFDHDLQFTFLDFGALRRVTIKSDPTEKSSIVDDKGRSIQNMRSVTL
ncbi:hypothetical protein C8R42DRAFT_719129 [Lentinula raphanica]|nr:hypothetical protein C8R42DRAFT_719129 [Lentinula raphanica]